MMLSDVCLTSVCQEG